MWTNSSDKSNFLSALNRAKISSREDLMICSHVIIHKLFSVSLESLFNSAIKRDRVRSESWFCFFHSGNLTTTSMIFTRLNTSLSFSCMPTSRYGVRSNQSCDISLFIWSELRSHVLISVNFDDEILRSCSMIRRFVDANEECFCDANSSSDRFVRDERRFSFESDETKVSVSSTSYHASTSNSTTQFRLLNT